MPQQQTLQQQQQQLLLLLLLLMSPEHRRRRQRKPLAPLSFGHSPNSTEIALRVVGAARRRLWLLRWQRRAHLTPVFRTSRALLAASTHPSKPLSLPLQAPLPLLRMDLPRLRASLLLPTLLQLLLLLLQHRRARG
jgi:hypothetical protein